MNLLNISDLTKKDILEIINIGVYKKVLAGKSIGLIFEKPSTRTRLSFKVGISQLGGESIDLRFDELNISREESFEDTFKIFDQYLDAIIYRTSSHEKLIKASKYFSKPIINALSDISHPCQIISDLFTLKKHFNSLKLNILWLGDINNVCFSLIEAVNLINSLSLTVCSPFKFDKSLINKELNKNINFTTKLKEIEFNKYDCVMTDVYISMNDQNSKAKISKLKPYQVNKDIMNKTRSDAVFMHCLPAKLGEEVTSDVISDKKSIVWQQAKNRLYAQKNILKFLLA